ncbi:stalk domain-containing protein [Paenibacillus aestuarii]|uniref:Stalk domain-containing protein n=1 Tax=Paenibacillus aestuarii TaxID=516965 RepID=A0ABW0JZV1_9BACL|nr:stalk domain-containing protein [Paenibacillus aestuarii]
MNKLKKIILILSTLLVTFISTTSADTLINITKSPITLSVNGEDKTLPKDIDMYNINGNTYVPIRYITNQLGGSVFYDQKSAKVSINYSKASEKYSSITSIKKFDDFTLELHSAKSTYDENEMINIWASLSYEGDNKIDFIHGLPTLTFSIIDQDGIREGGYITASSIKTELKAGNQINNEFPLSTIVDYNFRKSGMTDHDSFLENSNANQALLPPGTYTIKVNTSFLKGEGLENQQNESTEFQIKVK